MNGIKEKQNRPTDAGTIAGEFTKLAEKDGFSAPKWAAPIGAVVLLAAISALIMTAVTLFTPKTTVISNPADIERLERLVEPAAILDIKPFESIDKLNPSDALLVSITESLLVGDDSEDEQLGYLKISVSSVEQSCERIFGKKVKLSHKTVEDAGMTYEYDGKNACYHVPAGALDGGYNVKTLSAVRKGKTLTFQVAYLSVYGQMDESENTAEKRHMTYILKGDEKSERIISLAQN